jgi:hypothetical protein
LFTFTPSATFFTSPPSSFDSDYENFSYFCLNFSYIFNINYYYFVNPPPSTYYYTFIYSLLYYYYYDYYY